MSVHGIQDKSTVLIVDDETTSRLLTRAALEQSGFSVVEAENGPSALSTFERHRPDLVLLDVDMPEMDGFTVCRKLRERPNARHVPIVMLTGHDDVGSIHQAYAAGATDFIAKPINWALLGHRARYFLRASNAVRELGKSEEKFRLITENSSDFVAMLDRDGRRLYNSPRYREFFGDIALAGTDSFQEIHAEDRETVRRIFHETVETGVGHQAQFRWVLKDGSVRLVESQGNVVWDESGRVSRVVVVSRDVTERTKQQEKISRLSYYDVLTGLPNRRLYHERLAMLTQTAAPGSRKLAVVVADVRGFHVVNDNLGRHAGDTLLRLVAQRLRENLRASDTLGRIAGDQFGLIMTDVENEAQIGHLLRKIFGALAEPFLVDAEEVRLSVKGGVTVFPTATDGADADALLTNAEAALKKAKASPEAYLFYAPHINAAIANRLALESKLRRALDEQQFVLHYQPKVKSQTGRIVGLEGLLRWNDPEDGPVLPHRFIPLLEETGMILDVGRWVLRQAMSDSRKLRASGFPRLQISVNVSAMQMRQKDFPGYVAEAIGPSGPGSSGMEIEITESVLMEDIERHIDALRKVRKMGIGVALDDFGTGYSSLSYVARLPANALKIDRSFVADMTSSPEKLAIVSAVISLGHALGMKIVAEGVETEEQSRLLTDLECDEMQGYLFSRPVPLERIEALLVAGGRLSAPPEPTLGHYASRRGKPRIARARL